MWIEKYRPKVLDDVIGNTDTILTIKEYVKNNNIPDMIFYGSAGTGKSSTALAMCSELYPSDKVYDENVIELNASDERGICVVRDKIKVFAKSRVSDNIPFKIIILDEVDSMTLESMAALRMIIDQYSKITRFCLICNHIHKITDGLLSRCVKFHFKELQPNEICLNLEKIYIKENPKGLRYLTQYNKDRIKEITNYTSGDMRKSVMLLQYFKYTTNISELAGFLTNDKVNEIYINIKKAKTISELNIDEIICSGILIQNFLKQLMICVLEDTSLNNDIKMRIFNNLSKTDSLLADGCCERLNLLNVFIVILCNIKI